MHTCLDACDPVCGTAVAGSMCTQRVAALHDDALSGCPRIDQAFVRILPQVALNERRYACVLEQATRQHPCRQMDGDTCLSSFVAAMRCT
jgi:hypothetical protein